MLILRKINDMKILKTKRSILRTWLNSDFQLLLTINQDPKVMEYFPGPQDLKTTKNFKSSPPQAGGYFRRTSADGLHVAYYSRFLDSSRN